MTDDGVRLGTQGWAYDDWLGGFYAPGTRKEAFLARYAEEFRTVEIDSTFYGTPRAKTVRGWAASVPPGFEFSVKMPREITHERRMVGVRDLVREFYDVVREFGAALGCVLIQFEASFGRASESDLWLALDDVPRDLRTAVEFRDPAWYAPDVQDGLAARGLALAVADAPFVPRDLLCRTLAREFATAVTAPFVYARWVGRHDAVVRYDRVQIERADEIAWWGGALAPALRRPVYGYVNNHYQGHSPATVRALYAAPGLPHVVPTGPEQTSLF